MWNKINGATGYDLYKLGNQYLEKFTNTTDTLWFWVNLQTNILLCSPIWNGVSGLKCETINYSNKGLSVTSIYSQQKRFSATQVKVTISLSSWHNVDRLTIYKTAGGIKTVYKIYRPSELLQFSIFDTDLIAGEMIYQAELTFKGGAKLLSDYSGSTH